MRRTVVPMNWLGCAVAAIWASMAANAQVPVTVPVPASVATAAKPSHPDVALDEIAAPVRERVRGVLLQPTLSTQGPAEVFRCKPEMYFWLLDNQDRASIAWRRLGARCVEIGDRHNGRFGWSDGQGSDLHWDTVQRSPTTRVWYAEGVVRPGLLLPNVPIRAVVVLRHVESRDEKDRPQMTHQASLYVHADSKAAKLATRLFGASVPKMAEQYVTQLQLFFSALSRYLDRHPEQIEPLLTDNVRLAPAETRTPSAPR